MAVAPCRKSFSLLAIGLAVAAAAVVADGRRTQVRLNKIKFLPSLLISCAAVRNPRVYEGGDAAASTTKMGDAIDELGVPPVGAAACHGGGSQQRRRGRGDAFPCRVVSVPPAASTSSTATLPAACFTPPSSPSTGAWPSPGWVSRLIPSGCAPPLPAAFDLVDTRSYQAASSPTPARRRRLQSGFNFEPHLLRSTTATTRSFVRRRAFRFGSVGPPSTVAMRGPLRRARLRRRLRCSCSILSGLWTSLYSSLLRRTDL